MTDHGEPIRVVVANDSELVVAGVAAMLAPFANRIEVVATATGDPAIVLGPTAFPDAQVVLVDAFARLGGGLDAAAMLLSQAPPFRVVLYTDTFDEQLVLKALRIGVAGYLSKDTEAEQLVDALERVAHGEVVVDPRWATQAALMAVQAIEHEERWPGARLGLTRREGQVLGLLGEGLAPVDIARKLSISHETVRTHVKRLYSKLGVRDRASAVAVAWQEGVVRRRPMTVESPHRALPGRAPRG